MTDIIHCPERRYYYVLSVWWWGISRGVVVCRNSGNFLKKFLENQWLLESQQLFQCLFTKRYKNQRQKGDFWNLSDIFQWIFEKFLKKQKTRIPPWLYPNHIFRRGSRRGFRGCHFIILWHHPYQFSSKNLLEALECLKL